MIAGWGAFPVRFGRGLRTETVIMGWNVTAALPIVLSAWSRGAA